MTWEVPSHNHSHVIPAFLASVKSKVQYNSNIVDNCLCLFNENVRSLMI
jgi:hypothetical protein